MTIRSGGGPRDDTPHARPLAPGSYDDAVRPTRSTRPGRRRYDGGNGGGAGGFVRFLVFALVLGGVVLVGLVTFVRPLIASAVVGWAYDNATALRIPFVEGLVRDNLGPLLTEPAGSDPTEISFTVVPGDTPTTLAPRLRGEGLIRDERAFLFEATVRNLQPRLQAGNFALRRDMTPGEVVTGLVENRIVVRFIQVTFRESLRIEQVTAQLQTLEDELAVDPREFYELATNPPEELLADYPWLAEAGLPEGASLEGFLLGARYDLRPESTAEELLRLMLDNFERRVGTDRMAVDAGREMTFYEILTLASLVEREARLEEERPLIAGVYQNRLSSNGAGQILNADPTVFYALDTLSLRDLPFDQWRDFSFWNPPGRALAEVQLPPDLEGYQTYQQRGLPPGPICSPSLASIEAALQPDTEEGYLYFLAIPDGGGTHVFAKTIEEHNENRRRYGYS